jgi:hypothetical protein
MEFLYFIYDLLYSAVPNMEFLYFIYFCGGVYSYK